MASLTTEISTWRVLIADDKLDNLKLITLVLESRKAVVRATTNPMRVFDEINDFQPNLILLDLAMPGLNGWELHAQLRTMPELESIPIIALTALSMEQDIQKGLDAGFDGYITKPYRSESVLQQLMDCVRSFIERHP